MTPEPGETALALLVAEADEVVRPWRLAYDPSTTLGVPAHITVLGPFIPEPELTKATYDTLASIGARTAPLALSFERLGRFPHVLWLDPTAAACLPLFQAVHGQWPDLPPYGDAALPVVPHLTITRTADEPTMDHVAAQVRAALPFQARVREMTLLAFDGARWVPRRRFPFGSQRASAR
jgi:2'-5' RNA ligase